VGIGFLMIAVGVISLLTVAKERIKAEAFLVWASRTVVKNSRPTRANVMPAWLPSSPADPYGPLAIVDASM
jgi:hypothetical protein